MASNANSHIRLYHERLAPQGWEFEPRESLSLARAGWVDTPAKFESAVIDSGTSPARALGKWSRDELLAAVALVTATIGVLAAYLQH